MPVQHSAVETARQAFERGEWHEAYALLAQLHGQRPLTGSDLRLFAEAAYNAGHVDAAINTWERAFTENVQSGDTLAAAGAAVQTAVLLLFDTALMAPLRGWLKRAERLLEGHEDSPVHVWLAVLRAYERLLSGDFQSGRESAQRAIQLGEQHDQGGAVVGRIAQARLEILEGNVEEGVSLLNEAAVAAVSGELPPLATGIAFCEVLCGLHAVAHYDLAEQWAEAMERWHPGKPVGSIHGRCRVHKAGILRMRGAYQEAHKEALQACEELRPYLRREYGWPLNELGRIRLHLGEITGAKEAFLAAHQCGWDPQPGLAIIHLAEGDRDLALASIRDALVNPLDVPSKELPPNTELRRAPLLEAYVEIALACEDIESAASAADELTAIAERFQTTSLAGSAALSRGRVGLARGEIASARKDFEVALRCWSEARVPFEIASAHLGLGLTFRAQGNESRASLEIQAAQSEFQRIGATREMTLVAEALNPPAATDRDVGEVDSDVLQGAIAEGECLFQWEGDYWSVAFGGHRVHLRDMKGFHYIARLLRQPGREFHVIELVSLEASRASSSQDSREQEFLLADRGAGELLDGQAKEAYRRRLAEIEEDIDEAQRFGDPERLEQGERERDFLIRELARAVGLSGRSRLAGSAPERARVSVTRSIRHAISRIHEHLPFLGDHLNSTIRTGSFCAYCPDSREQRDWAF